VSGFVRGSDFFRDLPAQFSNHCDMMYLNADLRPGAHLRTVLAHEYTHAAIFSEHVFGASLTDAGGQDEEGWLNEGIAHVVEREHAFGWTNLDYRVSAFLSAPHRYGVVIPDYYRAGLWRSHGHRGATFLFLDACSRQTDRAFLGRLVRSPLCGTANLEAASGRSFAELFQIWTTSLAAASQKPGTPLFGTFGQRWLCGPRLEAVPLTGPGKRLSLAGTSATFLLLHSAAGNGTCVTIEAPPGSRLQATLLRLPPHTARMELTCAALDRDRRRLVLKVHDADVQLTGAAWECLVPTANLASDTNAHSAAEAAACARAWFGTSTLPAGEVRTSPPLETLPHGPFLVKVAGVDAHGTAVAAWTLIDAPR
jgi:hypothetical protein